MSTPVRRRSSTAAGKTSTGSARSGLPSAISQGKLCGMGLVKSWLETYAEEGKLKAEALRDLNEALGRKYAHNTLSRWERGEREPDRAARHHMLLRVLPALIDNPTAARVREAAERLR